jgi:hypothetical protein
MPIVMALNASGSSDARLSDRVFAIERQMLLDDGGAERRQPGTPRCRP